MKEFEWRTSDAYAITQNALLIVRGVRRLLKNSGASSLTELTLANGRRVDIVALKKDGTIEIIEVKSSISDFRADKKWREYKSYGDKFYFAVDRKFPIDILPDETGVIIADEYDAVIHREATERRVNPAIRRALLIAFAQCAANRLHNLADPPKSF